MPICLLLCVCYPQTHSYAYNDTLCHKAQPYYLPCHKFELVKSTDYSITQPTIT